MRISALLILSLAFPCLLHAQSTISGKVVDSKDGAPLAGASVKVKSSKAGTSTGGDGRQS